MKKIEYYEAEDGRQFEDYYECKDYEAQLKVNKVLDNPEVVLKCYDQDFKPMQRDSICNCFESMWYCAIQGEEALKLVIKLTGEFGGHYADQFRDQGEGFYAWDEYAETFINLERAIEDYKELLEKIKTAE